MATDTRFEGVGPDAFYWRSLNDGRFLLQHCPECEQDQFPPALVCHRCGSPHISWQAPSGKGVVYASTLVRDRAGDYNVSIIELEGGARMMSRVEGMGPEQVRIGMAVRARIAPGEQPHVVFTCEGEGS